MTVQVVQSKEAGISVHTAEIQSINSDYLRSQGVLWIDFPVSDRAQAVSALRGLQLHPELERKLATPGETIRISLFPDQLILDLNLCVLDGELTSQFVTIVIKEDKVVFLHPPSFQYLEAAIIKWNEIALMSTIDPISMIFGFFDHVMDVDNKLVAGFNLKVSSHSRTMVGKSRAHDMDEIERLRNDVLLIQEVLENQHTSFGLVPVQVGSRNPKNLELLNRLKGAVEHLQRVAERIEDRLDDISDKYLYDLQSETNRRINILTILQAIFVPMTFIAGVYGMNFSNMPELSWAQGYYFALGLMVAIAGLELLMFYRRGWFK